MKKSDNFDEKWGEETAKHGWVAVPTTLFFAQQALGINALELNVLLNLIMHWWNKENPLTLPKQLLREEWGFLSEQYKEL